MNVFTQYGKNLTDQFPLKLTGSVLAMVLIHHAFMFTCFAMLVMTDILSRWLAISAGLLRREGRNAPTLSAMVRAIPRARKLGLIRSSVMRERGLSKLMLYCLCVLTAGCVDCLMLLSGIPSAMTSLVVSYLSSAEALSVMENLSEAGFPGMTELLRKWKAVKK